RAGLSERSFHRRFRVATGQTPARFVELARLDAARMLLSRGMPLKSVATRVGLYPVARFTQAFGRRFGVNPRLFRDLHAELEPSAASAPAIANQDASAKKQSAMVDGRARSQTCCSARTPRASCISRLIVMKLRFEAVAKKFGGLRFNDDFTHEFAEGKLVA